MEKIVCLGDSITFGYSPRDHSQVENNYPSVLKKEYKDNYDIINSGNVGWQTKGTLKKIDDLCLVYSPKYCILMLGINDARGSKQGLPLRLKTYESYLQEIITILKRNDIEIILLTPTKVFNQRVDKFANKSIEVAKKNNLYYVDTRLIVDKMLVDNSISLKELLPDRVHFDDQYYKELGQHIYNNIKEQIK